MQIKYIFTLLYNKKTQMTGYFPGLLGLDHNMVIDNNILY